MDGSKRRLAANRIVLLDGSELSTAVVELSGIDVESVSHLESETHSTEWIGGRIELTQDVDGHIHAFKDGKMLGVAT